MSLKIIVFVISLLGISLLLILSQNLEPKLSKIYDLQDKQTFEKVKIQGQLISSILINNQTTTLLNVKDSSGKITVLFDQKITIPKDTNLEIVGKITEYSSRMQITADKIKILK